MEIYAYRARASGHDGNSVRGLRAALALPIAGVHIDARLTKDGRWALPRDIAHAHERAHALELHTRTLAQLRRACVPLDAALALFAALGAQRRLLLELHDAGAERPLVALLGNLGVLDRTVVITWDEQALHRMHALAPTLRLGFALSAMRLRSQGEMHKTMHGGTTRLAYHPHRTLDPPLTGLAPQPHWDATLPDVPLSIVLAGVLGCSRELLVRSRERGFAVLAYPVNSRLALSLLRRRGVHGAITSAPEALARSIVQ
jgi:glycerophosphoryl diester phosphodiesterase